MTAEQISNMFKGAHAVARLRLQRNATYAENFAKALKDAHNRFKRDVLNAAYKKLRVRISGDTYRNQGIIKSNNANVTFSGQFKAWIGSINWEGYERIARLRDVYIVIDSDLPVINKGVEGVTIPCRKCGTYCFGDCQS